MNQGDEHAQSGMFIILINDQPATELAEPHVVLRASQTGDSCLPHLQCLFDCLLCLPLRASGDDDACTDDLMIMVVACGC